MRRCVTNGPARIARRTRALALLICDIDWFKAFNDRLRASDGRPCSRRGCGRHCANASDVRPILRRAMVERSSSFCCRKRTSSGAEALAADGSGSASTRWRSSASKHSVFGCVTVSCGVACPSFLEPGQEPHGAPRGGRRSALPSKAGWPAHRIVLHEGNRPVSGAESQLEASRLPSRCGGARQPVGQRRTSALSPRRHDIASTCDSITPDAAAGAAPAQPRHDWTRAEIEALFAQPFTTLVFDAASGPSPLVRPDGDSALATSVDQDRRLRRRLWLLQPIRACRDGAPRDKTDGTRRRRRGSRGGQGRRGEPLLHGRSVARSARPRPAETDCR